ncbi:SusC/RagA family TonB-linked outer membrane protein [Chryseobacterium sp.]|uniref:SusC/RagA family TonB-linked outer membrane protein n=1 Tax=Chryseobacterium sp. TaxID=1871047 RepID=UPI0011C722E7|nr:SusC/RagA family TonB-linked outer membrane protein [Chryseobacterium sp.]TXF77793.1 SusC/RagA family TonB-linked outer membrane protein [Chryseobacterium sp.]
MKLNQHLTIPIILLLCSQAHAQTRTVSGTVTADGRPLAGVTVSEEGRDEAAVTGVSGTYQLTVQNDNPVLLFRHPNFGERREEIGDQIVFDLSLEEKVSEIKEVVLNAGYYEVKAKESTGSISKVTAKDIENQPVTNVLSAVQGRMAGVNITQNSGTAGSGYDIQIRGRNSLRTLTNSGMDGNTPLYVIDGVVLGAEMTSLFSGTVLPLRSISPLNAVNPNDIESIEILKDADATAIYGSRGANGVVLITTKKSRKAGLEVTLNTSYALSTVASKMKLLSTEEYLGMRRQAYANDGVTAYPATAYDVNGAWDQNRYTDWQKVLIGNTAAASDIQLSLKGGSAGTRFLISLAHKEQGTVLGQDYRYTVNTMAANLTHRSEDRKFTLNFTNMLSGTKNNVVTEDVTAKALLLSPNAPALYKEDSSLNWDRFANPVAIYNTNYLNENLQTVNSLNISWEFLQGLRLKLSGGVNYQDFEEWSLRPNTIYNPAFVTGQSSAYSSSSLNTQRRFSLMAEPQLQWNYTRAIHRLEILLGGTFQSDAGKQSSMKGTGFETNAFIQNIGAAKTKTVSDEIRSEYRYAAAFARVNWQYAHKYILNLSGRRDGSSRFGPDNRFADFGAVGAAWLFSKEPMLAENRWLSFGKLRASYGSAGSDNIGDYQYLDTYSVANLIYNGVTGIIPSRLYNPAFSWEKTVKLEAALELGFLKDRLNLTAAWYRNRSSNQLVGYQLPGMTGFTSVLANLDATVENTGIEIELSGTPVSTGSLKWNTAFNLTVPRSKLLAFPGLEGSTYANYFVVGEPTNLIKLYRLEGIDPATGLYRFTDFNGDGKITAPEDTKVSEHLGPRFFGGWSNTLEYRQWNLAVLLQGVSQKSLNYNYTMPVPGGMFNQPVEVLDVWSAANPGGTYMPYTAGGNAAANTAHNNFRNSTAAVSDGSYLRLKNIQLTYRLPVQHRYLSQVSIYVQGQNLLTWTKYYGPDPEFSVSGYLPPLKTVAFGTEFNF